MNQAMLLKILDAYIEAEKNGTKPSFGGVVPIIPGANLEELIEARKKQLASGDQSSNQSP